MAEFPCSSVRLLGPDQVLPAHLPGQGRARRGDRPLFETQIVFIFVQCCGLWRKGRAVVFFRVNFSPDTKGRGWKVCCCRRNGECRGSVGLGSSTTARCRGAPNSAWERELMKGRVATFQLKILHVKGGR